MEANLPPDCCLYLGRLTDERRAELIAKLFHSAHTKKYETSIGYKEGIG